MSGRSSVVSLNYGFTTYVRVGDSNRCAHLYRDKSVLTETTGKLSPPGRIMALDIGVYRIGVALSDPLQITVAPHETIERRGKKDWQRILGTIREQAVKIIVLGMPYDLNGEHGESAKMVVAFREELVKRLAGDSTLQSIPVETFDERYTSVEAERYLVGSKERDGARRAERDRVAAAIILERFLAQRHASE